MSHGGGARWIAGTLLTAACVLAGGCAAPPVPSGGASAADRTPEPGDSTRPPVTALTGPTRSVGGAIAPVVGGSASCAIGDAITWWTDTVQRGGAVTTVTLSDVHATTPQVDDPPPDGSVATVRHVRLLAGEPLLGDGATVTLPAAPGGSAAGAVHLAESSWGPVDGPALLVVSGTGDVVVALPVVGDRVILGFSCQTPGSGLVATAYHGPVPGADGRWTGDPLWATPVADVAAALSPWPRSASPAAPSASGTGAESGTSSPPTR